MRTLHGVFEVAVDERGVPTRMFGVAQDITARRRAEEALQRAYADLQCLNRRKDEILATVSHEVRTPLVAVKNAVSSLAKGRAGAINAQQARLLAIISEQIGRMNGLLDDLLDAHTLESGCMTFALAEGDLGEMIRDVNAGFRGVIEAKGLSLELELPSGPLRARFDHGRLGQVLLNLLCNAVKFTPERGAITVRAHAEPGMVGFAVVDTGCGMPAEALPRLFDKFFQVDGGLSRQVGGTGLGLPICKQIVEDGHGGRIWVESEPGRGSTVTVAIPIDRPA